MVVGEPGITRGLFGFCRQCGNFDGAVRVGFRDAQLARRGVDAALWPMSTSIRPSAFNRFRLRRLNSRQLDPLGGQFGAFERCQFRSVKVLRYLDQPGVAVPIMGKDDCIDRPDSRMVLPFLERNRISDEPRRGHTMRTGN